MDIIDRHFAAENAHDVEATLATYTDDVVWDDITHPRCPVHGKAAAGEIYTSILDAIILSRCSASVQPTASSMRRS